MNRRSLSNEALESLVHLTHSRNARARDFEELFDLLEAQSPQHARRLAVATARRFPQSAELQEEPAMQSLAGSIVSDDASIEDLSAFVEQLEAADPNLPKSLAIAVDRRYPKPSLPNF